MMAHCESCRSRTERIPLNSHGAKLNDCFTQTKPRYKTMAVQRWGSCPLCPVPVQLRSKPPSSQIRSKLPSSKIRSNTLPSSLQPCCCCKNRFPDTKMPHALQNFASVRKVLLRDRLPRHIADAMDSLPIPKIYLPALNISPYPDTRPEYNPRLAASRVLSHTNAYRRKYGKSSLRLSNTLCEVARYHSEDQADRRDMTHTGAGGTNLRDRLDRLGYRPRKAGENVAFGYTNEEDVFHGWRTSPGHRKNLLLDGVDEMGAWVVKGRDGLYWTQVVGSRK